MILLPEIKKEGALNVDLTILAENKSESILDFDGLCTFPIFV